MVHTMPSADSIFIKSGKIIDKVNFDDILWIKSDGNYSLIHTASNKYVVKKSLVKMSEFLPDGVFIRIHMKYIVLFSKIKQVDLLENTVIIEGEKIPIGPRYRSELLMALNSL